VSSVGGRSKAVVRRVAAAVSAAVLVGVVVAAVVAPAGPAAVTRQPGAKPPQITVALTDRGCKRVSRTVRSAWLRIRVVNRGHALHTFTIRGRHSAVRPGHKSVLRVSFPRSGRYAYACSRSAASTVRGRLHVVLIPTAARPCGVAAKAPRRYRHVVWIVMENKSWFDVMGSSAPAPHIQRLARLCGAASSFYGEANPSLPDYLAMTSGGTQGVTDDKGPSFHPLAVDNIFQQAGDWRSLVESMPAPCTNSSSDGYFTRHNPALYYVGLKASCPTLDVPLGATPDISAKFTMVTPNGCHDMDQADVRCASTFAGVVQLGDAWLGSFLKKVFKTPQYRSGTTAVFVTWDESSHGIPATQKIPTLVMAPSVFPGTIASKRFDHYALLRSTEQLLGLPLLGAAASAPSMRAAFHF
jgi:hypothetical protein